MAYNELLLSMELGAREKIREMLEAARMAAEEILRDARRESGEIVRKHQSEAADAVSVERNRSLYLLREEMKSEEATEKGNVFNEVFVRAGEALASTRGSPGYRESFSRLLKESLEGIGHKDLEVHIDPRDAGVCAEAIRAAGLSGFRVVPDLTSNGGLVVRAPDGSIQIDNTYEARLVQGREVLKQEIYTLLFGD